jgi:hypothetical protein
MSMDSLERFACEVGIPYHKTHKWVTESKIAFFFII